MSFVESLEEVHTKSYYFQGDQKLIHHDPGLFILRNKNVSWISVSLRVDASAIIAELERTLGVKFIILMKWTYK